MEVKGAFWGQHDSSDTGIYKGGLEMERKSNVQDPSSGNELSKGHLWCSRVNDRSNEDARGRFAMSSKEEINCGVVEMVTWREWVILR